MPKQKIRLPNGQIVEIDVPEGASPQQIQFAVKTFRAKNPQLFVETLELRRGAQGAARSVDEGSGPSVDMGTLTRNVIEDVGFPAVGAGAGALLGAPLGPPGILVGGLAGGMSGEAAKQIGRSLTGRLEEVPQGFDQTLDIATAGLGGAIQEAAPLLRSVARPPIPKPTPPQVTAAGELGVDITKGQAFNGFRKTIENLLSKSLGGSRSFRELGLKQSQQLEEGIQKIASQISRANLPPDQAGHLLQSMLEHSRELAGRRVGQTLDLISKELPNVKVAKSGKISQTARDLLNEITRPSVAFDVPALSKVDDIESVSKVLRQFAQGDATASIEDTVRLKRLLDKLADFDAGGSKVGKSALQRLSGAVNESIESAIEAAKRPDLLKQFRADKANFGRVIERIESKTIQQILKEDKPEIVVDILLRKGSESRVERIIELIGEKNIKPVARSAVEKIFNDSSSEGILISQKFANLRDKIGDKTIAKLLGGDEQLIEQFERTAKLIDSLDLTTALTQQGTGVAGSGLLQGGIAGVGSGIIGANTGKIVPALAFSGGVLFIPAAVSKLMTSKLGLVRVQNIIKDSLAQGGKELARARFAGLLVSEATKSQIKGFFEPRQDGITTVGEQLSPEERRALLEQRQRLARGRIGI